MFENYNPYYYSLDSFVIDEQSQINIRSVHQLLESGFSDTDVLIIQSQRGCGSSHLMWGMAKELKSNKADLAYFVPDEFYLVPQHAKTEEQRLVVLEEKRTALLNKLDNCSYLLLDDFLGGRIFANMIDNPKHWFRVILNNYILSGGKIICAHSDDDKIDCDFQEVLKGFCICHISLGFPSKIALEKSAQPHFPIELIQKYGQEVYCRSTSIRMYHALLTSIISILNHETTEVSEFLDGFPRAR
jgi:hypothetical protein